MEDTFKKIENLEEEIKRLKSEIEKKKTDAESVPKPLSPEKEEQITSEVLKEHILKYPPEELGEKYRVSEQEKEEKIKNLEPEEDDRKIEGLFEFAKTKGVINGFILVKEMLNKKQLNPHLVDDIHRKISHWLNFER